MKAEVLFSIDRDGAAGVYQLWLGNECMYVGQTQNIFQRMVNHWHRKFDRIVFIPVVHWIHRLNLEEMLIRKLQPKWNISLCGGRLSEDRRCKAHGARGRDISGDRYANHRLMMNIAIEKAETQKKLAEIIGVTPQKISHYRRTGDIPAAHKQKIERYCGVSVDVIASFITENSVPDHWGKREYFNGDWEDEAA